MKGFQLANLWRVLNNLKGLISLKALIFDWRKSRRDKTDGNERVRKVFYTKINIPFPPIPPLINEYKIFLDKILRPSILNPHTLVAQKVAVEVVFRRFQGEGAEFFF